MDYKEKLQVTVCTKEGPCRSDEAVDEEEMDELDYAFTEGWLTAARTAVLNSQAVFLGMRDAVEVLYQGVADSDASEEFIDALVDLCSAKEAEAEGEGGAASNVQDSASNQMPPAQPVRKSAWEEDTIALGKRGEDAAARCLEIKGYTILARNYQCDFGEADIVAEDENGTVVFVEVKTRRGLNAGIPEEAITSSKRRRYEKIALEFMSNSDYADGTPVRFDAIGICVKSSDHAMLRHHLGFFDAGD